VNRYSYYLGLDLGQAMDYTALCILQEPVWIPSDEDRWRLNAPVVGWVPPDALAPMPLHRARTIEAHTGRPEKPVIAARHLERFPLHTPYPAIVERVVAILHTEPLAQRATALVVDQTGVGAPVIDLLRAADLGTAALIPVTITAGTTVTREHHEYGVPKRDLVSAVAVLLESRRLQIAETLPEARTLVKELSGFQRKITRLGNDTYEAWREGQHDDLVLAVALAGWFREWWNHHLDQVRPSMAFDAAGNRIA
jgi:hypothetical protein